MSNELYTRIFGPLPSKLNVNDLKCCGNCNHQYGTICFPYQRKWHIRGVCERWELHDDMGKDLAKRHVPPRKKSPDEVAREIAAKVREMADTNQDIREMLDTISQIGE